MKIVFMYDKWSFVSWAIRKFTRSEFSHVAIMDEHDVYEASQTANEVIKYSAGYIYKPGRVIKVIDIKSDFNQTMAMRTAVLEELGKPYDYMAIVGFLVDRYWQDDRKWFCSEFTAYVLMKGGVKLNLGLLGRITPGDLWGALYTNYGRG